MATSPSPKFETWKGTFVVKCWNDDFDYPGWFDSRMTVTAKVPEKPDTVPPLPDSSSYHKMVGRYLEARVYERDGFLECHPEELLNAVKID